MLLDPLQFRLQLEPELVELQRLFQLRSSTFSRSIQAFQPLLQLQSLFVHGLRIEMVVVRHFLAVIHQFFNPYGTLCQLVFEQLVRYEEIPARTQIGAQIRAGKLALDLLEFVLDVFHESVVVVLSDSLSESPSLLQGNANESLPFIVQIAQGLRDILFAVAVLGNQCLTEFVDRSELPFVGSEFPFECLVLLEFAFQIGEVSVALVRSGLQFFS